MAEASRTKQRARERHNNSRRFSRESTGDQAVNRSPRGDAIPLQRPQPRVSEIGAEPLGVAIDNGSICP